MVIFFKCWNVEGLADPLGMSGQGSNHQHHHQQHYPPPQQGQHQRWGAGPSRSCLFHWSGSRHQLLIRIFAKYTRFKPIVRILLEQCWPLQYLTKFLKRTRRWKNFIKKICVISFSLDKLLPEPFFQFFCVFWHIFGLDPLIFLQNKIINVLL